MTAIRESVTLDRVQLHSSELIEATLLTGMRKDVRRCDDRDAIEMRRSFTGWGKIERRTLTCPATWWQHLKLTLRTRWPRIFGNLRVRTDSVTVENGALVTGFTDRLPAKHTIIPIAFDSSRRTYVDDPRSEQ